MAEAKILSIDWDYFFPDSWDYDWGANEVNPIFMTEMIWHLRAFNRPIQDPKGPFAIDAFRVQDLRLKGFWERLTNPQDSFLVIAESHEDMYQVVRNLARVDIYNVDAHHDLGYGNEKEVGCGCWGKFLRREGLVDKFIQYYPPWRESSPDKEPTGGPPDEVHYGLPEKWPPFWGVFICRSSAWTPAWDDWKWIEFINWWAKNHLFVWNCKMHCPFALNPRNFCLDTAIKLNKQMKGEK